MAFYHIHLVVDAQIVYPKLYAGNGGVAMGVRGTQEALRRALALRFYEQFSSADLAVAPTLGQFAVESYEKRGAAHVATGSCKVPCKDSPSYFEATFRTPSKRPPLAAQRQQEALEEAALEYAYSRANNATRLLFSPTGWTSFN